MIVPSSKESQSYWNDELRQLNHSIAKDCDEAFSSSLLSPGTYTERDTTIEPSVISSSMVGFNQDTSSMFVSIATPTPISSVDNSRRRTQQWDSRPLPLAPPPTDSVLHEIMIAKQRTSQRGSLVDESPNHVDRMLKHLDKLVPSGNSEINRNSRTVSAPIFSRYSTQWGKDAIPLPSISEGKRDISAGEGTKPRIVSAPAGETPLAQSTPKFVAKRNGLDYLARQENTIRMVMSPSTQQSPVKIPAPLKIRKKVPAKSKVVHPHPRKDLDLRQQYAFGEIKEPVPEEASTPLSGDLPGPIRKKSSWFKRTSKDKHDVFGSMGSHSGGYDEVVPQTNNSASTSLAMPPARKRSFSLAFWRNTRPHEDMKLSAAGRLPLTAW